jgi:Tfp pilus assembly protein PilF
MKMYAKILPSALAITAVVLFVSSQALAGHGGGGGGFHGGGGGGYHGGYGGGGYGGGGYHGYGGGGYSGYHGGSGYSGYHGGASGYSGYHGGESAWHAGSHTPSFSTPHTDFSPTHSNLASGAWSHNVAHPAAHSAWADHANTVRANHPAYPDHGYRPDHGYHPDWYHGNWHDHGDHYWHHWPGWWGSGFIAGAALADLTTPWSWGYIPYANPYCAGPIVVEGTSVDYSQPLALAAGPAADSTPEPDDDDQQPAAPPAAQPLDAARAAFQKGDYAAALAQCDKAIATNPKDTMPNELRGAILFAMHRYDEAAAALYAVLSVGPGWDWTTMDSLYGDVSVYSEQLRALEKYVHDNPDSAQARFVLAYQYLTCGYADAAAKQFKAVVRLNPKDQLSAQILSALTTPETTKPSATVAAPPKPVKASALVGNWKATRSDGKTISLNLSDDGKYTWTYAQKDKPQTFSGDYSVADNLLVLKQKGTPVMVGQVTSTDGDGFNFKLPGNNPNDPGLTFGK